MTIAQERGLKVSDTRKMLKIAAGENNSQYGKYGENHPKFGHKHSEETKKRQSDALKGKPHKKGVCTVCGAVCSVSNLSRWHNANCKSLTNFSEAFVQSELDCRPEVT